MISQRPTPPLGFPGSYHLLLGTHSARPSPPQPTNVDGLFNRLLAVQIFASAPAYSAADKASKELMAFYRADGKSDQALIASAFDDYLRPMRKELGVKVKGSQEQAPAAHVAVQHCCIEIKKAPSK